MQYLATFIVWTYFGLAVALILALAALVDAHVERQAAERWRDLESACRLRAETSCWEMGQAFGTAVRQAIASERTRLYLSAYQQAQIDQDAREAAA